MNVEITEQWIGQCAGGKVLKEARSLLKRGRVVQVKRTDGVFQGLIGSEKPMRVVVKVISRTHIKNLCNCTMSRRTGALCEHATALMLAGIGAMGYSATSKKREEEPREVVKKQEVVPLEINLAPDFRRQGTGAVNLRPVSGDVGITSADGVLAAWLHKNTGACKPMMLSLKDAQLGSFLRAAHGHDRVQNAGGKLDLFAGNVRPLLDVELDSDNGGQTIWVKLQDDSPFFLLGGVWSQWDEQLRQLALNETAVPLQYDLSAGDWLELDTAEWVAQLQLLHHAYQCDEGAMGGLEIREAQPGILLEMAGSTRALQVRMSACYGEHVMPLGGVKGAASFQPYRENDSGHRWHVRNQDAEQFAMSELMSYGFQILDASGFLFLRGEDEVLDFLTVYLPSLRKKWRVETEAKLGNVEQRLTRIVPSIELRGGGEGWLNCEVAWQCGSKMLDPAAVRKMMQSGTRTVALPQGGKAVISQHDADVMQGFLLDVDPRQKDGIYQLEKNQAGYVDQLQQHYRGATNTDEKHPPLPEEKIPVPPLDDDLHSILRPYQLEGVQWLFRHAVNTGAALLADDMGLGKTLQTLAFLQLWKNHQSSSKLDAKKHYPALIVCPASLLGNWRDEIEKFVPKMNALVMHGQKRKDYFSVMSAADIIITSYALLDKDVHHYRELKPSAVVLDEASAIRNPDTLAAKAVRKVMSPMRLAISGTPVENSVRDMWSIFQFMMPGYLGTRDDFKRRYELPCQAEVPDFAALERLRWRTAPHMLRRTKSLVAKDLPPKIESVVWCDMSTTQRDYYRAIQQKGIAKMDALRKQGGADSSRMQMLTLLLRLRQSCCDLRLLDDQLADETLSQVSAKLARLMELLGEAIRGGHRVLVFSQFTSMLSLVRQELEKEQWGYCYLDGATRDRAGEVKRFQDPSGPPVFLISLKAGGYGLTLTAADTVVIFDPWWNPAVEAQAADRIHRIGQTRPASIYKMIARGTVEEKILRLQQKKLNTIQAAMGEETAPMMHGLREDEIMDLLG